MYASGAQRSTSKTLADTVSEILHGSFEKEMIHDMGGVLCRGQGSF